jgi:hypothetical protein
MIDAGVEVALASDDGKGTITVLGYKALLDHLFSEGPGCLGHGPLGIQSHDVPEFREGVQDLLIDVPLIERAQKWQHMLVKDLVCNIGATETAPAAADNLDWHKLHDILDDADVVQPLANQPETFLQKAAIACLLQPVNFRFVSSETDWAVAGVRVKGAINQRDDAARLRRLDETEASLMVGLLGVILDEVEGKLDELEMMVSRDFLGQC